MRTMLPFLSGAITAGFVIAGLFLFRFWVRTKDIFFAALGVAFWLFAINQAAVTLSGVPREFQNWLYLLRLAGFVVIIVAILAKNLGRSQSRF